MKTVDSSMELNEQGEVDIQQKIEFIKSALDKFKSADPLFQPVS